MAKERPFHTATHRADDVQKQQFFAIPAGADPDMEGLQMAGEGMAIASASPASAGVWPAHFVSRITHDLMNALGAASSFGEMLVEDISSDDPRHPHAEKALQGCALAMRLVKMLRDPVRWCDQDVSYLDVARAELQATPQVERRADVQTPPPQVLQAYEEDVASPAVPKNMPEADAPAPAPPHESLRILVVDGRSTIADSVSHAFDRVGHKAFPVYDPQEALNLFYETPDEWDVVICPVILRGQGGAGLLQKMKAVDARVLTVLSTGTPTPEAFCPTGCDLVVESAAGAQKISAILAAHMARAGRRPRVRVVA